MEGIVWTPEIVADLAELWAAGKSAKQCAAAIAAKFRVFPTRSAILGKVYRLGLSRREESHWRRSPRPRIWEPPQRPPRRRAASLPPTITRRALGRDGRYHVIELPRSPLPDDGADVPIERRIGLLDLTNETCRWPHGDPSSPDFFFCGMREANLAAGKPYCRLHAMRALRPAPDADEEKAA